MIIDQDIERRAFNIWKANYNHFFRRDLNETDYASSLREARKRLLLASTEMSVRLNISKAAYTQLERKEMKGEISIKKLKEVAEAMGCELCYQIKPLDQKTFSLVVWKYILPEVLKHSWVHRASQFDISRRLAAVARWKIQDAKFRRKHQLITKRPK